MIRRSPIAGALVALTLVTAACGNDDDGAGAAATTVTKNRSTAGATAPAGEAPDATVSPDLPPEVAVEVGAMQVIGDTLPQLGDATPETDPAAGTAAPVIIGQDYDGNTVRIDAAADGPTMVVFLAHWCPHCNAEVPRLNELRDAGRFPEGLNIVAVSTAIDPSRPNWPPSEWITDTMDWTYPVVADGIDPSAEVAFIGAGAYGVDGFPFVALVDGDGNVAARWSGEREPDQVIEAIDQYLGL